MLTANAQKTVLGTARADGEHHRGREGAQRRAGDCGYGVRHRRVRQLLGADRAGWHLQSEQPEFRQLPADGLRRVRPCPARVTTPIVLAAPNQVASANMKFVGLGRVEGRVFNPDGSSAIGLGVTLRSLNPGFGGFYPADATNNGGVLLGGQRSDRRLHGERGQGRPAPAWRGPAGRFSRTAP